MVIFSVLLMASFCASLLWAKKKAGAKESPFNYQELSASKKLNYLSSLIFAGKWQEALDRLLESGNLKLDDSQKKRLVFIQGYLHLMSGKAKEAAAIFEGLDGKYPEVAPILPYWTARAQRLAGDPQKALNTLEKSCGGPCASPSRTLREYAVALCESGNKEKAAQIFDQIQGSSLNGITSDSVKLDLLECKMKTGEASGAFADLREMYIQAPVGVPPERLKTLLQSLHKIQSSLPQEFSAEDRLARIATLKAQDRWVEAARELKDTWPQLSEGSHVSMRMEAAETYFKARTYREAAEQYEWILKEQPDRSDRREIMEKLASAYARSNQFDKAIQTHSELESGSEGPSAERSYKIAFLLADGGRCEEAGRAFQDFLDRFPKSSRRDDALWQKAWCDYQLKKYDAALNDLNQLEAEFPRGAYAQRTAYWRYRILESAGRSSEAKEARAKFIGKYGESFHRRWDERHGRGGKPQCPVVDPGALFAKTKKSTLDSLFSSRGQPESSTLRELLSLGLWEDFLEVYQKGSNGGLTLGDSNDQLTDWVHFFAESEQVPPELVWAVIREESHFKPKAFSNAGAMGLMQIIPQTGFEIAQSLKLNQYTSDDLFEPLINVRFGVHYLRTLLNKFSGNLVQAIAAYNAGPEAVERWQGQRPTRPCDEFIEEIPYRETHNYVMKVMKSLWNYRDNPPNDPQIANQ